MSLTPRSSLLLGAVVILAGLGFAACEGQAQPPAPPAETPESPESTFRRLEERMLSASAVRITGTITSEGAVESTLSGTLALSEGQEADLRFSGIFASQPVDLHLVSDGVTMRGGSAAGTFQLETPAHLREAILIGASRMGLLHNLAMLASGAPPDRADGTVREWVQASGFGRGSTRIIGGLEASQLTFRIRVGGSPAGEVILWIAGESGLPVQREQTVHFETGEMHVTERYEIFQLGWDGLP